MIPQVTDITGTRACAKSAMKGWFTQYSQTEEFEAKSDHLLAEVPVLPDEWKISFKLKPRKATSWLGHRGSSNVLLLTNWVRGFSPPRIFLGRRGVLRIISGVNGPHSTSYFAGVANKLQRGEWVEIQISQEFTTGLPKKLMYQVIIDGVEELSLENKTPQFFENVKVYTGWSSGGVWALGCIKNICSI